MRLSFKTACNLGLLLATSVALASTAPVQPKKAAKVRIRPRHHIVEPASNNHSAQIIQSPQSDTLPITTSSPQARELFEAGIHGWERLQIDSALKRWRTAVNVDSRFALAHLLLSYCTPDPVEEQMERKKAKSLAAEVSPGERLLITWLSGVRENDYLTGIVAMNELLQNYPKDKQLLLWAGSWMFHEKEYELSQKRLEQAAALDAAFAPPLNDLGYVYAYQGDFDRALTVMQHYVELLPNEPNPQDSYAEILRMAGRYDEALEHYRAALHLDPNFHSSQLGIADTYSLMGQQKRARQEYFNARVLATDKLTELQDVLRSACTYVRDRDAVGADQAFEGVTQQAHRAGLPLIEAEAWRMRARLQFVGPSSDLVEVDASHSGKRLLLLPKKHRQRPELEYLVRADQVLRDATAISETDRQEEYALLVRERAEAASRRRLFAEADAAVAQLETMASHSPSSAIQHALNGAKGAVLLYEGSYEQAVTFLERDNENAFSLFRLAFASQKNGTEQLEQARLATARALSDPTAEQAFIGPSTHLGSSVQGAFLTPVRP